MILVQQKGAIMSEYAGSIRHLRRMAIRCRDAGSPEEKLLLALASNYEDKANAAEIAVEDGTDRRSRGRADGMVTALLLQRIARTRCLDAAGSSGASDGADRRHRSAGPPQRLLSRAAAIGPPERPATRRFGRFHGSGRRNIDH